MCVCVCARVCRRALSCLPSSPGLQITHTHTHTRARPGRPPPAGINTFFGRAAALISATNNVANIAKVGAHTHAHTHTHTHTSHMIRSERMRVSSPPQPPTPNLPSPQVMTKIGAICLVTIFVWCIIELGVQFGLYRHSCRLGPGARRRRRRRRLGRLFWGLARPFPPLLTLKS